MGVFMLWSYMMKRKEIFFEHIDLVQKAKSREGGIKLLIDFYCWEHYMSEKLWKSINYTVNNHYLLYDGGEYKLIDNYIRSFVESLRSVNIELIFFLDGAKGSSLSGSQRKWKTWQFRHNQDHEKLKLTLEFLNGTVPLEKLDKGSPTRPCLQELQNISTLQSLGCTIVQKVSGEADDLLAQYMRHDPDAIAVFSNDTDFCIFPDNVFLHHDFFDCHNNLGLGEESLVIKIPEALVCGVIRSDTLVQHFQFPSTACLTELSIILGNDFTKPLLHHWPEWKAFKGKISDSADKIRLFRVVENCPVFNSYMEKKANFKDAVRHSRQFYSMTLRDEAESPKGYLHSLIVSKIKAGAIPSAAISMFQGMYWHRMVLEDVSHVSADESLSRLRAFCYAILLPKDKEDVTEYGRQGGEVLGRRRITKMQGKYPSLVTVNKNSPEMNKHLFLDIINHLEPFNKRDYFSLYGPKLGYVCHLLRYFLLWNWDTNLSITRREFLVLCAWVLHEHDTVNYMRMAIVPSPRCVTVENWFLMLFRLTFGFLGNLLGLSNSFPVPSDLFSGATWVVLYTAFAVTDPNPDHREPRPLSVPKEDLEVVANTVSQIIGKYRSIIDNILGDVFTLR